MNGFHEGYSLVKELILTIGGVLWAIILWAVLPIALILIVLMLLSWLLGKSAKNKLDEKEDQE